MPIISQSFVLFTFRTPRNVLLLNSNLILKTRLKYSIQFITFLIFLIKPSLPFQIFNSNANSHSLITHILYCIYIMQYISLLLHHTLHLLCGFMGLPSGQLYAFAKSLEFDNGPITRMIPGECTEDLTLVIASSGRIFPHQICA